MKRLLNIVVFGIVGFLLAVIGLQFYINGFSKKHIHHTQNDLQKAYTGIVLGASVRPDGSLSPILQDRVDAANEAYQVGKVSRLLLSGDHGDRDYDEVNAMKNYLNNLGVPDSIIFLDHAGFDTYDSMWRAKKVFQVEDAIVFTQEFHLPRAVYLAHKMGINAQGMVADQRKYTATSSLKKREWLANIKAFIEINIEKEPSYDGPLIPITGQSELSHDKN